MSHPQMFTQREQEANFRRQLRQGLDERAVQTLNQLLNLRLDKIKADLLAAVAADVPGLQGEGRALKLVVKWLNEPVPEKSTDD